MLSRNNDKSCPRDPLWSEPLFTPLNVCRKRLVRASCCVSVGRSRLRHGAGRLLVNLIRQKEVTAWDAAVRLIQWSSALGEWRRWEIVSMLGASRLLKLVSCHLRGIEKRKCDLFQHKEDCSHTPLSHSQPIIKTQRPPQLLSLHRHHFFLPCSLTPSSHPRRSISAVFTSLISPHWGKNRKWEQSQRREGKRGTEAVRGGEELKLDKGREGGREAGEWGRRQIKLDF